MIYRINENTFLYEDMDVLELSKINMFTNVTIDNLNLKFIKLENNEIDVLINDEIRVEPINLDIKQSIIDKIIDVNSKNSTYEFDSSKVVDIINEELRNYKINKKLENFVDDYDEYDNDYYDNKQNYDRRNDERKKQTDIIVHLKEMIKDINTDNFYIKDGTILLTSVLGGIKDGEYDDIALKFTEEKIDIKTNNFSIGLSSDMFDIGLLEEFLNNNGKNIFKLPEYYEKLKYSGSDYDTLEDSLRILKLIISDEKLPIKLIEINTTNEEIDKDELLKKIYDILKNENKQLDIMFNKEIYKFEDLKEKFEKKLYIQEDLEKIKNQTFNKIVNESINMLNNGGLVSYYVDYKVDNIDDILKPYDLKNMKVDYSLENIKKMNYTLLNILNDSIYGSSEDSLCVLPENKNNDVMLEELNSLKDNPKHKNIINYIKSINDIAENPYGGSYWDVVKLKSKFKLESYQNIKDNKVVFENPSKKDLEMVDRDLELVKNNFELYYNNTFKNSNVIHKVNQPYPQDIVFLKENFDDIDIKQLNFDEKVELINDVLETFSYQPVKNYLIYDDKEQFYNKDFYRYEELKELINDFIDIIYKNYYDFKVVEKAFDINQNENKDDIELGDKKTFKNFLENPSKFNLEKDKEHLSNTEKILVGMVSKDPEKLFNIVYNLTDEKSLDENRDYLNKKYKTNKDLSIEDLKQNYTNLVISNLYGNNIDFNSLLFSLEYLNKNKETLKLDNIDVLKISNICDNYIKNTIEFIKEDEVKNEVKEEIEEEIIEEKKNKNKNKLK